MTEIPKHIAIQIDELVNACADWKRLKDDADSQYKMAKSTLETICAEHRITEFSTDTVQMKITESRRFKAYSDDEAVLRLIPIQHHKECTSLNKKKIDALIKKGVLPNSIKDKEKFTRITTTKFTKVE